jgi:hypothetical protein
VRLGWTRLPAEVSDFEITHFFSLRAEERSAVLTRYRDSLRLDSARAGQLAQTFGRAARDCGTNHCHFTGVVVHEATSHAV